VALVEQRIDRPVPLVDLRRVHEELEDEIVSAIRELIQSSAFTNGPQVAEFEDAFASFCGTRFAVGVASGLDALRLALLAAGLREGDEVLVPANTFIASFEAVTQAGGTPVPVDVTESDYNLDVAAAEPAVTPRARFVLPVHLYGQMCDMLAVREFALRHDLLIVEDACQAHGAKREGIGAGTGGNAGAFSFYPSKNLGAFGDAGALVTDDEQLADRVRMLREHGQQAKDEHAVAGWTARLDTIQALILLHKLPHLTGWIAERRAAAALYAEALAEAGDIVLPRVAPGSHPVWHLFVIRTANRDALADFLAARQIATGRHYPSPVHLTRAYGALGYRRGDFPVAEALADTALSLPLFPGISELEIELVTNAISEFFTRGRRSR
jgi:dTDP-4-amino-4,6-dideoxygalactose transaminase